ncbi:Lactose regulatory protein LAC9 [Escovopsis weberi]|uniref:Lactose regulatory protein LAC9 n=1 Tax=Escovopsis weberi TaxID=150374 RepID=A0A0M8N353_ESCWE|nr:Lactose regulatory protein LAC9 [Escovopsis weberi]
MAADMHVSPLLSPEDAPPILSLGSADQACKECRRRKSKHLTEVEERLEKAEAFIRQMRSSLPRQHQRMRPGPEPSSSSSSRNPIQGAAGATPSAERPSARGIHHDENHDPSEARAAEKEEDIEERPLALLDIHAAAASPPQTAKSAASCVGKGSDKTDEHVLESPPETEDFGWDEQETTFTQDSPSIDAAKEVNGARQVLDGMASLTFCEKQSGYLGIASGAALLRVLEPALHSSRLQGHRHQHTGSVPRLPLVPQPNPNKHIADTMIDAYFRVYHVSYPIIHEATFRAQYSEVIPRPNGDSWFVLAYVIAAIGVFTTSTTLNTIDVDLYARARSIMSFDLLEVGNLTMVQALALVSNYQQKRDKPNSAYSYMGLASRMAMALGLHREFQGWKISPLSMEIRRRVWWTLCVFDVGATITFSRPQVWPFDGVDISLPLNVHDRSLTVLSKSYPPEANEITVYTAVRTQAAFHIATNRIYTRVISRPLPTVRELLKLEDSCLRPWVEIMQWRYRNLRMIMYRPFVVRKALLAQKGRREDWNRDVMEVCDRCLHDAKMTITSIADFCATHEHIRVVAWYALYAHPRASEWKDQIHMALRVIVSLAPVNPSAARCHRTILSLCAPHLDLESPSATANLGDADGSSATFHEDSIFANAAAAGVGVHGEVQTVAGGCGFVDADAEMVSVDHEQAQDPINAAVFSMMWPHSSIYDMSDMMASDDAWLGFLPQEDAIGEP